MDQIQETEYIEVLPGSNVSFSMIKVEGGEFEMGSEEELKTFPNEHIHQVSLDSYYISKYPVIQVFWESVVRNGKKPFFFSGAQRPVENIIWEEIQDFINELNDLTKGKYRLPSEAEWEYACRGGNFSKEYVYAGSNELKDVGWFNENSHKETKDVGQKFPNELGIHDMSGNVWEICQDRWGDDYFQECAKKGIIHNPQGPLIGNKYVIRGGGWLNDPEGCRSTYHNSWEPNTRRKAQGFRLAFSL